MTAQRSKAELNRLDAKAARLRCEIYKAVKDRPGFGGTCPDFWPESWEKEVVVRLKEAGLFFSVPTVSVEMKFNALREAVAYAEEKISKHMEETKP